MVGMGRDLAGMAAGVSGKVGEGKEKAAMATEGVAERERGEWAKGAVGAAQPVKGVVVARATQPARVAAVAVAAVEAMVRVAVETAPGKVAVGTAVGKVAAAWGLAVAGWAVAGWAAARKSPQWLGAALGMDGKFIQDQSPTAWTQQCNLCEGALTCKDAGCKGVRVGISLTGAAAGWGPGAGAGPGASPGAGAGAGWAVERSEQSARRSKGTRSSRGACVEVVYQPGEHVAGCRRGGTGGGTGGEFAAGCRADARCRPCALR